MSCQIIMRDYNNKAPFVNFKLCLLMPGGPMQFGKTAVKTFVSLLTAATCSSASAQVVSHLNLVSDKSQDISTLDAWKKTYGTDSMSEQDKSIAIFNTLVRYRHQANPPREFLSSEEAGGHVHDPLQSFHVYGYGQCCCAASEVIGLAQQESRFREIHLGSDGLQGVVG